MESCVKYSGGRGPDTVPLRIARFLKSPEVQGRDSPFDCQGGTGLPKLLTSTGPALPEALLPVPVLDDPGVDGGFLRAGS